MFAIFSKKEDVAPFFEDDVHPSSGATVSFDGLVRNLNENKEVRGIDYQVYEMMSLKEGHKILAEAIKRFGLTGARAFHYNGYLVVGEPAVKIVVHAPHRKEAFEACMYIIDEIKKRLPIWKREVYTDGESQWVYLKES